MSVRARNAALDDQMHAALCDTDSEYHGQIDALTDAMLAVARTHAAMGYDPTSTAERLMNIASNMVTVLAMAHYQGRL